MQDWHFAREDIAPIVDQVHALAQRAAAEFASLIPWAVPSVTTLLARQEAGCITFTARHAGELVGFCFAKRVGDGACDGGMFVLPEHRGGLAVLRLVQCVEREMRALGARFMVWECDEASGSAALARRLRHRVLSTRYYADLTGEA